MKVFYLPESKKIVARSYDRNYYSLPNLEVIDKPSELRPCLAFMQTTLHSKWYSASETFDDYISSLAGTSVKRSLKIRIHKMDLNIRFTRNEANERLFQLEGNLPVYVLDGIAKLLIHESKIMNNEDRE